jgi:periplasmic copper chaperone A
VSYVLSSRRSRGRARTAGLLASLAVLGSLLAGCGDSGSSHDGAEPAAGASASAGALTLTEGRVPMPASPDVGVAYFTVRNDADEADRLVSATTPVAGSVMPMKDVTKNGASTMVMVPALVVPAHGRQVLAPGALHLMLNDLTRRLQVGDRVELRLRFEHAGVVRVALPVIPLTGSSTPTDMSSMSGM